MNSKPILIVSGEPNSIFLEIFFKCINSNKFKRPLILISSKNLVHLQMKKLNYKFKINIVNEMDILKEKLDNKKINLINVNINQKKPFEKVSKKSKKFIENCFNLAISLIKKNISDCLINGPVSKKFFLNRKDLGITEYLARKTSTKNFAMLIYNNELSVCPVTTHLPLKLVSKKINKKIIIDKVKLIHNFYKIFFKTKPKIGVAGLNPHCESKSTYKEDEMIIKPLIKKLKKNKYHMNGPYGADTIFLKKNRKRFNVIVGMYHDQVLAPLKTLYELNAINITLGLPFVRITPDHGINEKMIGKNLSDPTSLIKAIKFLDKN